MGSFGCSFFCCSFGFWEFKKQATTATSTLAVYACVHSQWPIPTAWAFRCLGGELLFSLWNICLFAVFGCVVFERSFAFHSFACSFLCRSFTSFIQGTSVCLVFKLLFKFRIILKHSEGRSSFLFLILKY